MDDILFITKDAFIYHMKEMEKVLHKISESGLKVNAENSFFVKTKTDYLSFWVSKKRVRPLFSKIIPH